MIAQELVSGPRRSICDAACLLCTIQELVYLRVAPSKTGHEIADAEFLRELPSFAQKLSQSFVRSCLVRPLEHPFCNAVVIGARYDPIFEEAMMLMKEGRRVD